MMIERMARAIEDVVAERLQVAMMDSSSQGAVRAACASVRPEDVTDEMVAGFWETVGLRPILDTVALRRAIAAAINAAGNKSPAG